MHNTNINPQLAELRSLSAVASGEASSDNSPVAGADFSSVFKTLLGNVNQAQQDSTKLAQAFELGKNPTPDLADVMIAVQKAKLAFQATLQVRNKLAAAYQDVMNMPL